MKRALDRAGIVAVLDRAGIAPGGLTAYEELTEGTYNSVYRLTVDAQELVLKYAPDPSGPGLTHEQGLIETETAFYRAARGKAPVPEVVRAGDDFLLMTALPGTTLQSAGEERTRYRRELGAIVRRLHEVTGSDGFGYPQRGLVPSWSAAFLGMMDDVLADAARFGVALPDEVSRRLVLDRIDLLDGVRTPRLVHFDLWDGNILVAGGRITGLIDGERAFWGDPVAEFVSLTLFSAVDDELVAGYGSDVDRERLALYRVYLYLIMLVEGTPRGYEGPERDGTVKLIERHLAQELAILR
ncbi:aminoglycoside phosphotransferase [Kribbella flavida DSM 17836]|uniref:Aminoglycoside phosphotransferase n=1 Tax=Kribbella flavida (strain DSM 17836 / JCM 10339 / NBRC 14399) TaxID=479435 RepID=D2Q503_KRIFD|nr:aminoglycoside phosphotransferase family protein [Kribbella flavida]ADB34258.1 aminoglycoside phosphotransferase [Kribbella flavida DSM 17836]